VDFESVGLIAIAIDQDIVEATAPAEGHEVRQILGQLLGMGRFGQLVGTNQPCTEAAISSGRALVARWPRG
jgi:phosphatidylserine decarboxylase